VSEFDFEAEWDRPVAFTGLPDCSSNIHSFSKLSDQARSRNAVI